MTVCGFFFSSAAPPGLGRRLIACLILACFWLAITPLAFGAPAPRANEFHRILIVPVDNPTADPDIRDSFLGLLRGEIARLPSVTLINNDQAVARVDELCGGNADCLAKAGKKYNADAVLSANLNVMGEMRVVDLRLISVASGRQASRITESMSGQPVTLIEGIRGAAYKLLLPDKYVGTVKIDTNESGAEIFLDNRSVGVTPFDAPLEKIAPGKHSIRISKTGYIDFDSSIDVKFDQVVVVRPVIKNNMITAKLDIMASNAALPPLPAFVASPALSDKQTPPPTSWWTAKRISTLAMGTLGLGALGMGVYYKKQCHDLNQEIASLQASDNGPVWTKNAEQARRDVKSFRSKSNAANTLLVAGGVTLASSVVLWFTWSNRAPATPVITIAPGQGSVGVAGEF